MHVAFLSLRDFRSYPVVELSLGPGATVLVGPNGEGKTNLLEAVSYAATLGSHRVASDGPLVRAGADRAVVRAQVDDSGHATLIDIEVNPGRANRARINRSPVSRLREILGALRSVLFSPDDLALVKGDPAERRRFLDDTLVARMPRQAAVRADYERVLKQRNALLKSASGVERRGPQRYGKASSRSTASGQSGEGSSDVGHTLDIWDAHLARSGAELVAARLELLATLRPLVQQAYERLAQTGVPARMSYVSSIDGSAGEDGGSGSSPGATEREPDRAALEKALLERLGSQRDVELERGVSLVGPHRDELALGLGELPARGYASHGESWSLAFALRLGVYELLRGDGVEPVLLLDDVFAELDPARRERLAYLVSGAEQVLVTAANAGDVPEALDGFRMRVAGGEVRRDE